VYDERTDQNVALSKAGFASNVLNGAEGFRGLSFEGFEGTLDQIQRIVDNWKKDQR
jgi:hypothetical protein